MRSRTPVAAALLALALSSCRGCGPAGPEDVRDLAAPDASAAFVVPRLELAVQGLAGFVKRLTREAGADSVEQLRETLRQQLGLDPLDVSTYARWGLDPTGGAALFTEGNSTALILALPVSDRSKLDEQLAAYVARTDGASKLAVEKVAGVDLHTAGRPFGGEVAPAFHWAHVGHHVLVVRALGRPGLEAALGRLAGYRPGQPALRTEAAYVELTGKLPAGEMILFGRGDATPLSSSGAASVSRGAATSLHLGADGLSTDTFVSLALPGLETLGGPAPAELASRVGEDAVLVLLSGQARPQALASLRAHPTTSRWLDRVVAPLREHAGLDPEKDVAPLLAGPLTASVHLTSPEALATQLRQRVSDPYGLLDGLHVVITATVADPRGMTALLDRSRAVLEKRGLTVVRKTVKVAGKDAIVYTPLPKGAPKGTPSRVEWALWGDRYVYAAGLGRLELALAVQAGTARSMAGGLGKVAGKLADEPGATVVLVRAGAIATRAQALVGAPGAVQGGLESLVNGGVALLRSLGDVACAVSVEPGGVRLKIRESLE